jgi:hypothetical protein
MCFTATDFAVKKYTILCSVLRYNKKNAMFHFVNITYGSTISDTEFRQPKNCTRGLENPLKISEFRTLVFLVVFMIPYKVISISVLQSSSSVH